MFSEPGGDFPRNTLIAGMNPPNRFEHLLRRHVLQQVPISPCFECPPYLDVPQKCRRDNNSSIGKLRSDPNENFDSTVRELKIQECDIRSRSAVRFDALLARCSGRCQRHIRLAVNNRSDARSNYGVAIDDQDPYIRNVVRTLSTTLFQADVILEDRLSLTGQPKRLLKRRFRLRPAAGHEFVMRAAPGGTIGVSGASPRSSAGNQDRMSG